LNNRFKSIHIKLRILSSISSQLKYLCTTVQQAICVSA